MNLEILIQTLDTLEPTVRKLLSLGRTNSLVKEKIERMEQCIIQIPSENNQLAIMWRERLADWWLLYDLKWGMKQSHFGTTPPPNYASVNGSEASVDDGHPNGDDTGNNHHESSNDQQPSDSNEHDDELVRQLQWSPQSPIELKPVSNYHLLTLLDTDNVPSDNKSRPSSPDEFEPIPISKLVRSSSNTADLEASSLNTNKEELLSTTLLNKSSNYHNSNISLASTNNSESYDYYPDTQFLSYPAACNDTGDNFSLQLIKNQLRSWYEVSFDRLPPVTSSNDIDSIKKLAQLIARSNKAIYPLWKNGIRQKLQLEFLTWAMAKMSDELKKDFGTQCAENQTLSSLGSFLCKQIVKYYTIENAKKTAAYWRNKGKHGKAPDEYADGQAQKEGWSNRCCYCKSFDHLIDDCEEVMFELN